MPNNSQNEYHVIIVVLVLLLTLSSFVIIYQLGEFTLLSQQTIKIYKDECDNTPLVNVIELIEKIKEDCDSTHLMKQTGSNDWSAFVEHCRIDGYCKFEYVKLKECLNYNEIKINTCKRIEVEKIETLVDCKQDGNSTVCGRKTIHKGALKDEWLNENCDDITSCRLNNEEVICDNPLKTYHCDKYIVEKEDENTKRIN